MHAEWKMKECDLPTWNVGVIIREILGNSFDFLLKLKEKQGQEGEGLGLF